MKKNTTKCTIEKCPKLKKRDIKLNCVKTLNDMYIQLINEGFVSDAKTVLDIISDLVDDLGYDED